MDERSLRGEVVSRCQRVEDEVVHCMGACDGTVIRRSYPPINVLNEFLA